MTYVQLRDLLDEVKPGFACGEEDGEGIFQLRMNNVTRDGRLDLSKKRLVPRSRRGMDGYLLRPGDVVFNSTNSPDLVGKTALFVDCGEPVVFSNHLLRLRVKGDRVTSAYVARWLQTQFRRGTFRALCRQWVNQATVGQEALLDLAIPLPSLSQQQRIVAVLDQVDELRAKRRETVARLDELVKSCFLEMFGDPVMNARQWPSVTLAELGRMERGVSTHRPRNSPELLGGRYPLVQTGEVASSGGYIQSYKSTYSERGLAQSRLWPAGTLCITIAANIAKTGILSFDACFPDSVVGFTSSRPMVYYVQAWLGFLQQSLERSAPESAQKNINLAILRNLAVPRPPDDLIVEFVKRSDAVHRSKESYRASLAELDGLFASVQDRAFRGEL